MRTTLLSRFALASSFLLGAVVLAGSAGGCTLALQNDFDFPEERDAGFPSDGSHERDARVDGATPVECESAGDCARVPFASVRCDEGVCEPTCDAGRDDCNGDPTDGCEVDVATDPSHCGGCGSLCAAAAGASVSCVASSCRYACQAERADCDTASPDCESELGTPSTCASCDHACDSGELCNTTVAPATCGLDCPSPGSICGESCVDVRSSVAHCGGCGMRCEGMRADWACADSACEVSSCEAGHGDCNGVSADGCEVDVRSTLAHCGACGVGCAPANAVGVCAGGACGIAGCDAGRDDCNADAADGCEIDLATDALHCGACGDACEAGEACIAGRCDPVVRVAPGPEHTCALRASGRALCWGTNEAGQLGDGTIEVRTLPAPVVTSLRFDELALGQSFTCGIVRDTARIHCWGRGGYGELGSGDRANRTAPVPLVARASDDAAFATRRFVALRALTSGACALDTTGDVWCWGRNTSGEVGDGTTTIQDRAVRVSGVGGVSELATGAVHVCARSGATVRCWGGNSLGQLGDGTTTARGVAAIVPGLPDVTHLAALSFATCAISAGRVWCWGRNVEGELGLTGTYVPSPTENGALADLLACGSTYCFARAAGGWVAWGSRAYGEHGDGTDGAPRTSPAPVPHARDVPIITSSMSRTSCRIVLGRLSCWGIDSSGQIGARDLVVRAPGPVRTSAGSVQPIDTIGAGDLATCVVVGGEVRCAGRNDTGVLGRAGFPYASAEPITVGGIGPNARSVAAGRNWACAVTGSDGSREVWCWGSSPGIAVSAIPVRLTIGAGEPLDVSAGYSHACARVRESDGDVVVACWGTNDAGELGRGTTGAPSGAPQVITGSPTDVAQIALGFGFGCARRTTGEVQCWGLNGGRLGDGTTANRATPAPVTGLVTATDLAAGSGHACASRTDGAVLCWGGNHVGQLGDGTTTTRTMPTMVVGLGGVATSVGVGSGHSCAVVGGRAFCWGLNDVGQLASDRMPRPGVVDANVEDVVAIFGARGANGGGSGSHTCAIHTDGTASCWGMGLFGRCASGEALWSATPVDALIPE